jgi:hypothetical protein
MKFDIISLAFGSSDDHPASKDGWKDFTPDGSVQYCSFQPLRNRSDCAEENKKPDAGKEVSS